MTKVPRNATTVQGLNEDTKEYFFKKVRLCEALGFNLEETKTQIAIELWSKDTNTAIMSKNHFDLDDLLWKITKLEALEAGRKLRTGTKYDQNKFSRAERILRNCRNSFFINVTIILCLYRVKISLFKFSRN